VAIFAKVLQMPSFAQAGELQLSKSQYILSESGLLSH
jgi:hypothetical protein